jgi:hypothetical protein
MPWLTAVGLCSVLAYLARFRRNKLGGRCSYHGIGPRSEDGLALTLELRAVLLHWGSSVSLQTYFVKDTGK